MKQQRIFAFTLSVVLAALAACSPDAAQAPGQAKDPGPSPGVIPVPREFSGGNGYFAVNATTRVTYRGGAGAMEAAGYFVEQAKHNRDRAAAPREDEPASGNFLRDHGERQSAADKVCAGSDPDGARHRTHTGRSSTPSPLGTADSVPAAERLRRSGHGDQGWAALSGRSMLDSARRSSREYIRNFID
jgi:hypothetical protein